MTESTRNTVIEALEVLLKCFEDTKAIATADRYRKALEEVREE